LPPLRQSPALFLSFNSPKIRPHGNKFGFIRRLKAKPEIKLLAPVFKVPVHQHLPATLSSALDLASIELENTTYITPQLQETFSDMVFTCRYNAEVEDAATDSPQAKVALFVERITDLELAVIEKLKARLSEDENK
jgi:hypothetical protein